MMAFCEPSKGIMCCSIVLPIIPREGGVRHKGNKEKDRIQKDYNNFGVESKNVIRFWDSEFLSDEKIQDRLYTRNI